MIRTVLFSREFPRVYCVAALRISGAGCVITSLSNKQPLNCSPRGPPYPCLMYVSVNTVDALLEDLDGNPCSEQSACPNHIAEATRYMLTRFPKRTGSPPLNTEHIKKKPPPYHHNAMKIE